jgi:hypothetical protein
MRVMRFTESARIAVAGVAVAAVALAGATGTASAFPELAGVRVPHGVNWTARTCAAFTAWQRHENSRNLRAVVTSSLYVPWLYLGQDVLELDAAVRGSGDVDIAVQYVYEDCHNGYGS